MIIPYNKISKQTFSKPCQVDENQTFLVRGAETFEQDLILIQLLELLPCQNLIDNTLLTFNDDQRTILHLLSLLLRDLSVCLLHLLQIFTSLVTPEHVLERSLIEMVVDVVESVLGDITNDQVGVLPGLTTLVGFHVTNKEFDEGRLSRTVRSKDGDTGGERNLESDIVELLDGLCRVLEANFAPMDLSDNTLR